MADRDDLDRLRRLKRLRELESRSQIPPKDPLIELQDLLTQQASKQNTQDLGPRIAELRKLTNQPDSGELAVEKAGILETLTGSKREGLRPQLEELPEFAASDRGGALTGEGFRIAAGLLSTADPKEQQDIIKSIIPEATFETSNDGTTTVEVPDGKGGRERTVLNKPGMSQQDFLTATAQMLAFAPAAKLAGLGKSLLSRLGLASAGAAGTEQLRQEAVIAQGSEQGRKPVETALAAGLGPLGEVIGPAKSLRKTTTPIDIVSSQAQAATKGLKRATGQDVGLFKAQQTLKPSELVEQALVPQLDAGAATATKALQKQNREVFDAASELINRISPESEIATGAERFRTASNLVIDASKARRRSATSTLFNTALDEGASVNVSSVKDILKDSLKESVKGSQQSVLRKTLSNISGKKNQPPSLRQLDNAKDAINAELEKKAGSALARKTQRILAQAKKELVDQMESASPQYKNAMDEFRRLSPEVERLEKSILGVTANKNDTQLKNIAQTIFDPKEGLTNPQAVTNAKRLIDEVDPGAWDDLLRVELNRRVGGIQEIIKESGEAVGNTPGQLRRVIFGNPSQRNILMKSANQEQRKNLQYLDDVLRRASAGRSKGSSTIPNKEALEKLRGSFVVIKNAILRPKETLEAAGGQAAFDRNVAALTDVLFDTRFQREMTKLKKMNPESKAAEKLLAKLMAQASRQQTQEGDQ